MVKLKKSTKATVCVVESLNFLEEDTHREGEIISRTLRLSEKKTHYTYLRSRDELLAFVREFGRSNHRYLHISCHGNAHGFSTTTGHIDAKDFANILAPYVNKRRVFLSACLGAESAFAKTLLSKSECFSVLAPVGAIYFDDAAVFWSAFYHLMFKHDPASMDRATIERTVKTCAALIGEQFRLFYKAGDKVKFTTIG